MFDSFDDSADGNLGNASLPPSESGASQPSWFNGLLNGVTGILALPIAKNLGFGQTGNVTSAGGPRAYGASKPLPSWVWPVGIGVGALVLLFIILRFARK